MADVTSVSIPAPATQFSQFQAALQTDLQSLFGLYPWENREDERKLEAYITRLQEATIKAELQLEYAAVGIINHQIEAIKVRKFFAANWKHDLLKLKYKLGKIQQRIDGLNKIKDECSLGGDLVSAITCEEQPLSVDSASIISLQQNCLNALFELQQSRILTQLVEQDDIEQLRNLLSLQDIYGHAVYKNLVPLLQATIAFGKTDFLIFLQNQIGNLPQISSLAEFQQLIYMALQTEHPNDYAWETAAAEQSSLLVTIALGHHGTVTLLISEGLVNVGGMSSKPQAIHLSYAQMAVALRYGHLELFQLLLTQCVQNFGYDGSNSIKQGEFIGHVVRNANSLCVEVLESGYQHVLDYILLNIVLIQTDQTVEDRILSALRKAPKFLATICASGKVEALQWLLTRDPDQVLLQLANDKDACVAAAVTNGHVAMYRYLSRLRSRDDGNQLFPNPRFANALAENNFAILKTHIFVDTFNEKGDTLSRTNEFGTTVKFYFVDELRYYAVALKYDLLPADNQRQFIALMTEIFANSKDLLPKEKVFLPLQAALDAYQARLEGAAAGAVQPQFTPAAVAAAVVVVDGEQPEGMPQLPAVSASVKAALPPAPC